MGVLHAVVDELLLADCSAVRDDAARALASYDDRPAAWTPLSSVDTRCTTLTYAAWAELLAGAIPIGRAD